MARKKWWVKHPMQARFMTLVLAAMLVPLLVVGGGFYYLVFYLLAKQMAFPEAIAANLVPVLGSVNLWMLFSLPLLLAGIWCVALVMTHRFAGPIERLEKELDHVIAGHGHSKIRMRKEDALKGIVERINLVLAKLK